MSTSSRPQSGRRDAPASAQQVFALMQQGMLQAAREMALGLLRREPRSAELLLLLAAIHSQMGNLTAGLGHIEQCLAVAPRSLPAIGLHARILHGLGRSADAVAACDAGLALQPGDAALMMQKVEAQVQCHESAAAWQTLQPLLSDQAVSPSSAGLAARVLYALGRYEEAIDWAKRAATDPASSAEVSRINWMQVAKGCNETGQFDDAIAACLEAHARAPGTFAVDEFLNRIDSLIAMFSPANLRTLARATDKSSSPVFLVGLPRSGMSLVEQIIASHPEAYGAGEIPDITYIARSVTAETGSMYVYPDSIADLTPQIVDRLARRYLDRLKELGGAAKRVTNKMLEQYEQVGLIWMLFPGARIIHVRRNPLDNCLSCYTRYLNSRTMPYVTSLEHLGLVYLQHERLMAHWKQALDIPILTVQYENLVADQERLTRQIIEFVGLPWDDRCLRYWEADRTVMTQSHDQVDKPIYSSSVARWKNYEKHLGPLRKALGLVDD